MSKLKFRTATIALVRSTIRLHCALAIILFFAGVPLIISAQQNSSNVSSHLTPLQLEIEKQRARLSSSESEERRDAVMRLGAMKRPESSRVAALALRDSSAIVRATASRAVLSLSSEEASSALLPLLQDRDEFVRQEAAYALGEARSRTSTPALIALLGKEKKDGVRGAAAVALGQIGDEAAVVALAQLVSRRVPASGFINRVKRSKRDENEFVRRAAAHSLGQIRSRAALPALLAVLGDESAPDDVRREAASSLGLIGDPAAVQALRAVLATRDPYLSTITAEALRKIAQVEKARPSTVDGNLR
jgi:HEAT repeat protein